MAMNEQARRSPQHEPQELELVTDLFYRQYDVLYRLTTQMLATRSLEDKLTLVLDALTSEFGYSHCAIALYDHDTGELRMRMALGFPNDAAVSRIIAPPNLGVPFSTVSLGGRPCWISRSNSNNDVDFLENLESSTDLLALPLFGGQWSAESGPSDHPQRNWFEDTIGAESHCIGMLYVAADRNTSTPGALNLLLRLADRIGLTVALAEQNERLTATVTRLEREREWVNAITQSVADPIVLTNLDNEILLQNRRAEELFSGSEEGQASEGKLRALKMNDLLFSAYLSSVSFSTGEIASRDLTLVDPIEGSDVHFEVVSTPAFDSVGERIGMVSVFRDVTDLRKANEEMIRNLMRIQHAESEARHERDRLNLIIENVGHPIVVGDANGNLILFNRKAEALFEKADPSPSALAAIRANSVKLTSFISAMASAPDANKQAEIELIDPSTGDLTPMEITSVEITGPRGQVNAVVSILHDLSGMRELERRRMQQQLFESEKLAAIGRLTASIAHEINNPLEAIKNSLFLLQTGTGDTNRRFLEIALKETERVSHIIAQMLGFTRGTGEAAWVDVNELLEETLILIDKKLRQAGARLQLELHPALPKIHARADQLRQVFLNLLLNAQQSISGKGTISVRTSSFSMSHKPSSISVEISDTGVGISDEDLSRIFEPFFSTRKKGSGLGLWVTQDIVRHHGGHIEVSSTPNRGTTFRIFLPVQPPESNMQSANDRGKRP